MAAKVKFLHRQKPVPAPAVRGSNRIGKQHRAFGDPVAFLKTSPKFEAVPFAAPVGDLVLSLDTVLPGVSAGVKKAKTLVFHTVGDTGGVNGTEAQDAVAKQMEQQVQNPGVDGSPAFFYHLGDVVYYNGISLDYPAQFFEPYQYYPANISPFPGITTATRTCARTIPPTPSLRSPAFAAPSATRRRIPSARIATV